jgi:hypothetical protein
MRDYESFLNENIYKIKASEVDLNLLKTKGPNADPSYFKQGELDAEFLDDYVDSKKLKLTVDKLKPSQNEIYVGKTMGLVIHDMIGGDMKTMISRDNYIVDGHHRWAATLLHSPKEKLIATKMDLKFPDLVLVLRKVGDKLGNARGVNAENHGDKSLFDATIQDIKNAVFEGKYIDPRYYDKEKAIRWWNKTGQKNIEKRLKLIKTYRGKVFDIDRSEMPRILPAQVDNIANLLKTGEIDIRKGYSQEHTD